MLTENKTKKQVRKKTTRVIVSKNVKDYGNEPFFIKKAEESKGFLEKHPIPKELLLKRK